MKKCKHSLKKKILHKIMNTKGILFHITGIICIIWFLVRVVPKPDRIRYPCQQMSISIATGYIVFWSILWGSLALGLGFWINRVKTKTAALLPVFGVVFVLVFSVSSNVYAVNFVNQKEEIQPWEPEPNEPIGVPTGANPGRVAWVWDTDATEKDLTGFWWYEENNNQEVLDQMMEKGIENLAGETDTNKAWDVLFKYFNDKNGKGDISYQPGEKIAIKVNLNNCWQALSYIRVDNERDANPYVVKALLHQLIDVVGVKQSDITIYDASRPMANWFYNRVYYKTYPSLNLEPEFPDVDFVDSKGRLNGRTQAEPSEEKVYFSEFDCEYRTLPKCVVEAEYLINMPIMKRHPIQNGVTLSGKNFFGTWIEVVAPIHPYHESGLIMGNAAPQVDLLSHKDIGGKTLLFLGDATYATKIDHSTIGKFEMEPFNNDWTNSLFFSQDPVAIDSVMYDFLHTEGTNPIEGSQNYLHQAAEPIPNKYDPEGDGEYLEYSLGVHEHWDKTVDIFSKDRYDSIDFVAVTEEDDKKLEITKPAENFLYINNKAIFRIRNTIIFGNIKVETDIDPGSTYIEKVEFYVDDSLKSTVEQEPYEWLWSENSKGKYNLRVDAYLSDDETISKTINLRKYG